VGAFSIIGAVPFWVAVIAAPLFPVTLMGASYPDIDHPQSIPYRVFTRALSALTALTVLYGGGMFYFGSLVTALAQFGVPAAHTVPLAIMTLLGLSGVAAVVVRRVYDIIRPRHRGTTHRFVPTAVLSVGLTGGAYVLLSAFRVTIAAELAGVVGALFFIGVLSHLARDGELTRWRTYVQLR
jgi:hypothetical protein